jgi:hypothetical protein
MKIKKDPKVFEYDDTEDIVDIFVREDPEYPYPFHFDDWYHQGFSFKSFLLYIDDFFKKNKLPYKVVLIDGKN